MRLTNHPQVRHSRGAASAHRLDMNVDQKNFRRATPTAYKVIMLASLGSVDGRVK